MFQFLPKTQYFHQVELSNTIIYGSEDFVSKETNRISVKMKLNSKN